MNKPEGDLLDRNIDIMLAASSLAHELRYALANGASFDENVLKALEKFTAAQNARNQYIEATDTYLRGLRS